MICLINERTERRLIKMEVHTGADDMLLEIMIVVRAIL